MWKLAAIRSQPPLGVRTPRAHHAIHDKEHEGYDLAAPTAASSCWSARRSTQTPASSPSQLRGSTRKSAASRSHHAEVSVEVNDSVLSATASARARFTPSTGVAPVLLTVYPAIGNVRLVDFKMRMLDPHKGSGQGRALTEWSDGERTWTTAGVSTTSSKQAGWPSRRRATRAPPLHRRQDPAG